MANELGAGRKHARGLFVQYAHEYEGQDIKQIYDLNEFHKIFLEEKDLTEYRAAIRCTGSWEEWVRIKRDFPAFRRFVAEWKDELESKLRSDALDKLLEIMQTGAPQVAAGVAKFIATGAWNKTEINNQEREESKRNMKDIARKVAETNEEEARMLEVIQGGR